MICGRGGHKQNYRRKRLIGQLSLSLKFSDGALQVVVGVFDAQQKLNFAKTFGVSVPGLHTPVPCPPGKLAVTDQSQQLQLIMQSCLALTTAPEAGLPPICANQASGCWPLRV